MQNKPVQKIIIGVDPGYNRVGIAILKKNSSGEKLLHSECFETGKDLAHEKRLYLISSRFQTIIEKFSPTQMSIETLLFSKNQKTALKVAEARGVILGVASQNNISVVEFNPNQVKLAVTGYGKSDKKQIITMINMLLKMSKDEMVSKKRHDDEYDAIALAITCANTISTV